MWKRLCHYCFILIKNVVLCGFRTDDLNMIIDPKIRKNKEFQISPKNPIFDLGGSSLDQTKENYPKNMELLLTQFGQYVVLGPFRSKYLIYIYI